jgi:hypothetical protein
VVPIKGSTSRFFDWVSASYYVTDNFKLSIGHLYTFGRNGLTLGSEYGFALGGGRMAALFAQGLIGEGGNNGVLGGVRLYFGQRDKTLIDRNRQDDPADDIDSLIYASSIGGPCSTGLGIVNSFVCIPAVIIK